MSTLMSNSTASNTVWIRSVLFSVILASGCDFSTGEGKNNTGNSDDGATATSSVGSAGGSGTGDAPATTSGNVGADGSSSGPEQGDQSADNLPQGAIELGELGPTIKSFGSHALSEDDSVDYFRFDVAGAGKTIIRFKKDSDAYVDLTLTSANPNADQTSAIISESQWKRNYDHVLGLPKGSYYLRVSHHGRNYVPYELSMLVEPGPALEPEPEPGNHFDEAMELNSIENGSVTLGGFVGSLDHSDFYRISTPANRTVKLSPSGTFGEYWVKVHKQDGVSGKLVDTWLIRESNGNEPTFETKEGGVYFVEVASRREYGALYKLSGGLL